MPSVVITIDCEGALHDRCYTDDYIKAFEAGFVPATWMIHVSMKDPTANTRFYFAEFFHKIPNWHEIGVKVNFENERGYIENEKERGNLIRVAKDALKSHNVKISSFRAGCFALIPSDIKHLEDIGILVDSSVIPDADYKMFVDWHGAPHDPYHSDPDDLCKIGTNRVLHVPIATHEGEYCYLDKGFDIVKKILDVNMEREIICIGARDYYDSVDTLNKTIQYLRSRGAHFTTLTQAASEHYEHSLSLVTTN
jgi:transcriptional regulator CtsR